MSVRNWVRCWRRSGGAVLALATVALLATTVGCAKKDSRVTVSGTVNLKGQPLTKGVVWIQPANGGNITQALIRPDGTFSVTEVEPGEVTVAVEEDFADRDPTKAKAPGSKAVEIPKKYKDVKTSELRFTIGPKPEPITVNLD